MLLRISIEALDDEHRVEWSCVDVFRMSSGDESEAFGSALAGSLRAMAIRFDFLQIWDTACCMMSHLPIGRPEFSEDPKLLRALAEGFLCCDGYTFNDAVRAIVDASALLNKENVTGDRYTDDERKTILRWLRRAHLDGVIRVVNMPEEKP